MDRETAIMILNNASYLEPKKKPFKVQVKEYAETAGNYAYLGFTKVKEITCKSVRCVVDKFRNNREDMAVGAIIVGSAAALGTFITNVVSNKDAEGILIVNETTVNMYDDPFYLDENELWN